MQPKYEYNEIVSFGSLKDDKKLAAALKSRWEILSVAAAPMFGLYLLRRPLPAPRPFPRRCG
jgi:hypothetical protein